MISEVTDKIGRQCIVVAVDIKKSKENIMYLRMAVDKTQLDAVNWCLECQARGAGEILLTSMDKDGTKEGFDNEILCEISNKLRSSDCLWRSR